MNYFQFLTQDWNANKNNIKGRFFTLAFRLANYASTNKLYKYIFFPYLIIYKFFFEWVIGFEIPYLTQIKSGLIIFHGQSLIIHENTLIGHSCTLRHSTTIGNNGVSNKCPIIGDHVNIGTHVCIIGPITIGNNVTIGAGAIVTKDVPPNSVIVGNPAKIIKLKKEL